MAPDLVFAWQSVRPRLLEFRARGVVEVRAAERR
jgi:hypothetical protein